MNWVKENWFKLNTRWHEDGFKKYFFQSLAVYVVLESLVLLLPGSSIGTLGGIFTVVLLALVGRTIYKNKGSLRTRAYRSFWVFIILYVILGGFGIQIFDIFMSAGLTLGLVISLNIILWITFFLYWLQENKLPTKSFAYISALSLFTILINFLGIIFLSIPTFY